MNFSTSASPTQDFSGPPRKIQPQIAKWRHFVALLIVGSYPIFSALSVALRGEENLAREVAFPTTVSGLLLFSLLQMAIFGVFWLAAWAFSRWDKRALFLDWRGGFLPIWQGFLYSFALRLGIIVVATLGMVFLLASGWTESEVKIFMRALSPDTSGIMTSISQNDDPVYRFLIVTLLPFVVAGMREELWRGATFAGMLALCPKSWSEPMRNVFVVAISSIVFGLGHVYQGPTGVFMTTVLGAGLGAMVLYHRSIWPAVIAHGFFNALSFAMALRAA